MKTIVASGSRTGSTAYCDTLAGQNNFNEIMNIEDLILPRDHNGDIKYDICGPEFLRASGCGDITTLWATRPIDATAYYYHTDNQLKRQLVNHSINHADFFAEHNRRLQLVNQHDTWCIKLMQYHGVTDSMVADIIQQADVVKLLLRRDKAAQAISMVKTEIADIWHNFSGAVVVQFDYDKYRDLCHSVLITDRWLMTTFQSSKTETVYYEDLDLSHSRITKNTDNIIVDYQRCQQILAEVQESY
jgi:hypothetical protein